MIRRSMLIVLALLFAGATAACGGGGDDEADDTTSDRSDSEAAGGDETTAPPSTAPPAGQTATTAPGGEVPPGGADTQLDVPADFTGEGSDAFCTAVRDMQAAVEAADAASVDQVALFDRMATLNPPAEIAGDWSTVVTVQQALASDPTGEALAGFDEAEMTAFGEASSRVAAYLGTVCGI
jgi:hypothetical protein